MDGASSVRRQGFCSVGDLPGPMVRVATLPARLDLGREAAPPLTQSIRSRPQAAEPAGHGSLRSDPRTPRIAIDTNRQEEGNKQWIGSPPSSPERRLPSRS